MYKNWPSQFCRFSRFNVRKMTILILSILSIWPFVVCPFVAFLTVCRLTVCRLTVCRLTLCRLTLCRWITKRTHYHYSNLTFLIIFILYCVKYSFGKIIIWSLILSVIRCLNQVRKCFCLLNAYVSRIRIRFLRPNPQHFFIHITAFFIHNPMQLSGLVTFSWFSH